MLLHVSYIYLPCFSYCRQLSLAFREHIPNRHSPSPVPVHVPVVVLHGLFGSKINWSVVASSLAANLNRKVYAVDVRNHGESPHSETMSYEAMTDDLVEFINHQQLQRVSLIGHSMGGKVAMCLALRKPSVVDRLVVVDVAPEVSKGGAQIKFLAEAMKELNIKQILSKTQADEMLKEKVPDYAVRQFLLTNLVKSRSRGSEGFYWKCNLPVLYRTLPQIADFPQFGSTFAGKTLFVVGSKSNYIISNKETENIKKLFPDVQIVSLETGHWVHAEKPKEFTQVVSQFLTE